MYIFSRRDFLKLTSRILLSASSVLGLGGIFRFLGHQTELSSPKEFDIGLASDYPFGSHTVLSDIPALLIHTESGFSALSLTCTHLGCTTKQVGDNLVCPFHNSRFSENGEVLHGPAEKSLIPLNVKLAADGHIILHT